MNIFVIGFLLFFVSANAYLGYKFIGTFKDILPVPGWSIAVVWFFLALCPILFRNEIGMLPGSMTDFFYHIGAYWIAVLYYGILLVLLCQFAGWLLSLTGLSALKPSAPITGFFVLGILLLLLVYGTYNASHPRITYYTINVAKQADTSSMRVVLVSDLHLGKINDGRLVDKIVNMSNSLQPDVVLFAGDAFDSDINSVYRKQPLLGLQNLQTKYGLYAIMGNHEYIERAGDNMAKYLREQGLNVLIDSYVELPNGVVVYGRDDYSHSRKPLELSGLNDQPVLVLDHQPRRLAEAQQQGADVLMSGHTHKGQIFPNNFITQYLYEIDYGYKQVNNLHVFVTNGIGTWGPPMRIGNTPEVVCIDINFTPSAGR